MGLRDRLRRGAPVRTNFDLTVNGPNGGWVTDPSNPVGDPFHGWPSVQGSAPVWWIGSDSTHQYPIGPNSGGYKPSTLPSVTYATAQIVGPISRLPWRVYRYDTLNGIADWENRQVELPSPTWVVDPQLAGRIPGASFSHVPWGERRTASEFWSEWIRSALWHGDGYLYYLEDINGAPKAGTLRCIHPDYIEQSQGHWRIIDPAGGHIPIDSDGYVQLDTRQPGRIIRLRSPLPGGVMGTHGLDLRVAGHVREYAANVYRAGVPYGYLKVSAPNMDQATADALKAKWLETHGTTRSIAVLNATTEFQPLSFSPVDAAMIDMKRFTLVDIAHAFGMPAWALDMSTDSTTYQNISDARSQLIDVCLQEWATRLEDALSSVLPYGTRVYVDFAAYRTPVAVGPNAATTMTNTSPGAAAVIVNDTIEPAAVSEGTTP